MSSTANETSGQDGAGKTAELLTSAMEERDLYRARVFALETALKPFTNIVIENPKIADNVATELRVCHSNTGAMSFSWPQTPVVGDFREARKTLFASISSFPPVRSFEKPDPVPLCVGAQVRIASKVGELIGVVREVRPRPWGLAYFVRFHGGQSFGSLTAFEVPAAFVLPLNSLAAPEAQG